MSDLKEHVKRAKLTKKVSGATDEAAFLKASAEDLIKLFKMNKAGNPDDDSAYEFAAAQEATGISLYKIKHGNIVEPLTDFELEGAIVMHLSDMKRGHRREVAEFVKYSLINNGGHGKIVLKEVKPVAFADEVDVLTWNRLPFSKNEIANISLDEIPGFKNFLSRASDPAALCLFLGSLLDSESNTTQYALIQCDGGGGKGALTEALKSVFHERVVTTTADHFLSPHFGEEIEGARVLTFQDENNSGFMSSGRFKEYTGNKSTRVNPKHAKSRTIHFSHKIIVFTNNPPTIKGNAADRRRLISISIAPDTSGTLGFKDWYDDLQQSGEKLLAYCYARYSEAVANDPKIRVEIPSDPAAIERAVQRRYEDIIEVIKENYSLSESDDDYVTKSAVHDQILTGMREKKSNRAVMQQIREALQLFGAVTGQTHGGREVYRRMKAVKTGNDVARHAQALTDQLTKKVLEV